jgi:Na+-driven multidrug efflux pump
MRYVSEGQNDKNVLKAYVSTSVWFTLLVYGAVVTAFFVFSEEIALFLLDDVDKKNLIKIQHFLIVGVLERARTAYRTE